MQNSPLFEGIREEWEARGEARGRIDTLLDVLEAKFGMVPEDLRDQLLELKDLEFIKDAVRKAVKAQTIDEFRRWLKS